MPSTKSTKKRPKLLLKRVYEPAEESDGFRILVDRLWPRGLTREKARIDLWAKDASPSDELRRRFHADPKKFKEFRTSYEKELSKSPAREVVEILQGQLKKGPVTLLFAASDQEHNNAVVLLECLLGNSVVAKSKEPRTPRGSKT